jgi:hypothetical protein
LIKEGAAKSAMILDSDGAAIAVCVNKDGTDEVWLDLENGIQIQFLDEVNYSEGDYWLIRTSATSPTGFVGVEQVFDANGTEKSGVYAVPLTGAREYAPFGTLTFADKIWSFSDHCWNGRKLACEEIGLNATSCPNDAKPCPGATEEPQPESPSEPTDQIAALKSLPQPGTVLSAAGIQALGGHLTQGKDITRRVPARYLNHEPRSAAYRRYRAALLVSEILEPTCDAYLAKVRDCLQRMQVDESERMLYESDARADFALANDFRSMMAAGRGLKGIVA